MDGELPKHIDDGALRDQDNVPLLNFLKRHDRAQPAGRGQPFFSGREAEINAFRSAVSGILLEKQANATIVVEGPPGVGKSALLAQFQEEMRSLPPVGNAQRRWLPVVMDGTEADSPAEIMNAVDDAIALRLAQKTLDMKGQDGGTAARRFLNWLNEVTEGTAGRKVKDALAAARHIVNDHGGAAMGFRIGAQRDYSDLSLRGVAARRRALWRDWQVMLLVDEAQRIAKAGGALSMLHQNTLRLPVTFCAFGLPGTAQALSKVGLSRTTVAYDLRLGSLDGQASKMVVQRCFAQYGVNHGGRWEEAILSRSADWPQHLATYLTATLTLLRRNATSAEVMGDARESSLSQAIRAGDANRAAYYARRMESLKDGSRRHSRYARELVAWMTRQRNGPPDWDENDLVDFLVGTPLKLSEETAMRFIDAAHHAGLLGTLPNDRICLPIPSFAGHLLEDPLPPIPDNSSTST